MGIKIEDLSLLDPEELSNYIKREKGFFMKNILPRDAENMVKNIINDVEEKGDAAVIKYTEQHDGIELTPDRIKVNREDIEGGADGFEDEFHRALETAIDRVRRYHEHVSLKDWTFTDDLGNKLGQKYTPLERVGIYIPGGKASYPSTLIMTALPAIAAGVKEIAVISPPASFEKPSPLALAVKKVGGITDIYRIGGVQGIAALTFGTETVKKVDKIVGPGNIYVTLAKKELFGYVDIDMIAGPSEVLIITDGTVSPRLTAIDLLAQAEHDEKARVFCTTVSMANAGEVKTWVDRLIGESVRKEIIEKSVNNNGIIFVVKNETCAAALANAIAPEHLEIQTANPDSLLPKIMNAGAIFTGRYSPEAIGDYVAGPSHVLPTCGTARFFSPLSTFSFYKFSSIINMSKEGLNNLGRHASIMAKIEGLFSHAQSISFRKE